LGIIHSLDLDSPSLRVVRYIPRDVLVCLDIPQGNYSVVVFGHSSGRLDESPVYQTIVMVDSPQGEGKTLFSVVY